MSGFSVIYGHLVGGKAQSLPFKEPTPDTLDAGLFYAPDAAPETLLSANLFCSNHSCPHIFGPYWTQAKAMIEEARGRVGPLGLEGIVAFSCERCGMTRVVSPESYDGLHKM